MRVQLPWVFPSCFLLFARSMQNMADLTHACLFTHNYESEWHNYVKWCQTRWMICKVFSLFATWLGWALSLVLNRDFTRSNRWGRGSTSMIRRRRSGRNFSFGCVSLGVFKPLLAAGRRCAFTRRPGCAPVAVNADESPSKALRET